MVRRSHDVSHPAYVWVVEKGDDGGFSRGADLLGVISPLSVSSALVVTFVRRASRHDLYCNLSPSQRRRLDAPWFNQIRTCSPPSALRANLTLPMLPAPIVLPRTQLPVCAGIVVLDLLEDLCFDSMAVTTGAGPPLLAACEGIFSV